MEVKMPEEFHGHLYEANNAYMAGLERAATADNTYVDKLSDFDKSRMIGLANRASDYFEGHGFSQDEVFIWSDETVKALKDRLRPEGFRDCLGKYKEWKNLINLKRQENDTVRNMIIKKGKEAEANLFGREVKKIIFL